MKSEVKKIKKKRYDKIRWTRISKAVNAQRRIWYKENPDIIKNQLLQSKYGISLAEYRAISASQNDLCAICKKPETAQHKNNRPFSLSVDHCHKTQKVRALLCTNCNNGIGKFKEDILLLNAAIEYLKKHQ